MQISLSSINWMTFADPTGPPHAAISPPAFLDAAAAAGASHIGWDSLTLGPALDTADGRAEIAALTRDAGFTCTDVGVLRIGADHGPEQAVQLADLAARLEARWVNAIIDTPLDDAVITQARACSDIVAEAGAVLCLEFMAHGPLPTLRSAIDLAASIGWERCRLLLDSWHLLHSSESWSETSALIAGLSANQIGLVQVADGDGISATAEEFAIASRVGRRAPGEGDHPLPQVLATIAQTGFDGPLSAEVLSFGARFDDPAAAATHLTTTLTALGASVSR